MVERPWTTLDADAKDALIGEVVEALDDFLENPDYQVAVGGNPFMVDEMLARVRAALNRAIGNG